MIPQTGTTNAAHAQTLAHAMRCTPQAYNNVEQTERQYTFQLMKIRLDKEYLQNDNFVEQEKLDKCGKFNSFYCINIVYKNEFDTAFHSHTMAKSISCCSMLTPLTHTMHAINTFKHTADVKNSQNQVPSSPCLL